MQISLFFKWQVKCCSYIVYFFSMKNFFLCFLVPCVFCSSLSLAQTEQNSSLMMMRLGVQPYKGTEVRDSTAHNPEGERRREEEVQDSDEEARGTVIHSSESREASTVSSKITQNNNAAVRDFKGRQIELITSKIDFLKANHPDQTDLISLLESYLQKYETILDLRTFDQWRTDALMQDQQKVTAEQQLSSKPDATKAQQSILNLLTCEHEILNALLVEPVQLERAQAYSRMRSIYALSKDAFENARRLLKQKSEYDAAINEHIKTEIEYEDARKAYYRGIEEHYKFNTSSHKTSQHIKDLYAIGFAKKKIFQAGQTNFNLYYGSLEKVKRLQQQSLIASDAIAKSASFFHQKATALERLLTQRSEQKEINFYHHQATTLDLLAQDHLSLAQAITEDNTVATEHIKKLISFALHAKSVFEGQLSIFQYAKRSALPQKIADNHQKSFCLLQEAGQSFLSAYQLLKDQATSIPDHQSQDSYHRGRNLMNTALVFQLPLIPDERRAHYHPDYLATIEAAQHHAERVIQTAPLEEKRLYHEKIASFLYERISVLNHYFETLSLKQTILPNFPSFYFLEQTASLFLESSKRFQQLCQFFSSQLDLPETKLLIKAAVETKSQANRLLFQTKALLFPSSAALVANQNQDLH